MTNRDLFMALAALLIGLWIGYWGATAALPQIKSNAVQFIARRCGERWARLFVLLLAAAFCGLAVAIACTPRGR